MRILSSIVLAALAIVLIIVGNKALQIGDKSLPPLIRFMNPFDGFWAQAKSDFLKDFSLSSAAVSDSTSMILDDRMVPHIYARDMGDALFAQGYIHAAHRLFQMDISARAAGGYLAEILGEKLIEKDRRQRQLGIAQSAKKTAEFWKSNTKMLGQLEQYIKGINHYIEQLKYVDYPIEYKLLNIKPEPWSIEKSALMLKSMTMMLAGRSYDIENSNMVKILGQERFDELYPDWNPQQSPIITDDDLGDIAFSESISDSYTPDGYYPASPFEQFPEFIGSNNWVISGDKSASGNPILCNDPHLGLTLPSIWYENHLVTPETNVYGVSIPGIPCVVIGFNDDIAWGTTNAGHDLWDWYEMNWIGEDHKRYAYQGDTLDTESVIEKIKVKNGKDVTDTIHYTVHGPVIAADARQRLQRSLSFRWIGNETPKSAELNTFINLNKAKNYTDFKNAIEDYIAPAQNFVYTDKEGHIALHIIGQLPIRATEGGKYIKDGSVVDTDWERSIPRDELPHSYDPERGYVSSANQHTTSPDYPYPYVGFFEDYRGRRINNVLDDTQRASVDDMKALQMDDYSLLAQDLLPYLLEHGERTEQTSILLDSLSQWDMKYNAQGEASTYFDIWGQELYDLIFDEMEEWTSVGAVRRPEWWRMIDLVINEGDDPIFDLRSTPDVTENALMLIATSLDMAASKVDSLSQSSQSLKWSDYQQRDINHIGAIPAFSKKNIASSGSGDTPNANWGTHGPSWRMIVEMQPDGPKAYGVFPGGQLGNPGHPNYESGISEWLAGEYFELFYPATKEQCMKAKKTEININPKEGKK